MKLPTAGKPHDELLAEMRALQDGDADWHSGKIWSLVYFAGDDVAEVLKEAYTTFLYTNGLSVAAFRSLQKLESEVIAMTAELLGGSEAVGNMTSGGTESILMAIKTARDMARARRPDLSEPEMVLPVTAHPAFEKGAHYFSVKPVHIPVDEEFRADVEAARAAITDNTVLIVGSAPCYPYGTVDPIPELAALARERGIGCHVDACVGGFLLPFLRRLGYEVPPWDFGVPGVTSISADLHKYGYAARGSSTVMYRSKEVRRHQFFSYADWPGGLYGSPTMAGSRPGGAIAAAWAVMNYLGEEGYLRLARTVMDTAQKLKDGINAIPGLQVMGKPDASIFSFASDSVDIYAVADAMDSRGWHLDRQQMPPKLHLVVTPAHKEIAGQFLADLEDSTQSAATEGPTPGDRAAMYGMLGSLPDRGAVEKVIQDFLDRATEPKEDPMAGLPGGGGRGSEAS
ncbi:MAG: aspartate aminotransferase family protein [Chloroflexi bacterium]|nr:aspartate aminotransferase family protein [Chloroflexota bacterium]